MTGNKKKRRFSSRRNAFLNCHCLQSAPALARLRRLTARFYVEGISERFAGETVVPLSAG